MTVRLQDNGETANGGVDSSVPRSFTVSVSAGTLTVSVDGPASGVRGEPLHFTGQFTYPVPQGHDVAWDFGDGTEIAFHPATDQAALTPTHNYTSMGAYTVTLTVQAADGPVGSASQLNVIQALAIDRDPWEHGKTALIIGGTAGNATIRVVSADKANNREESEKGASAYADSGRDHPMAQGRKDADDQGQDSASTPHGIQVVINGVAQGTFFPTGRLIIYRQAGDDDIAVAESLRLPAILYGVAGNDRLQRTGTYGPSSMSRDWVRPGHQLPESGGLNPAPGIATRQPHPARD